VVGGIPGVIKVALLVLRKDIAIEARSREIVYTTLLFAVSCVLIFSFAFVMEEGVPVEGAAAGILWIAVAFSGTLALGRTFERERYGETLRALLLTPGSRAAIYAGKLSGMVLLMLATEAMLTPMVAVFFVLGTIGFASVGTLFAAMLVRTRTRDVLLPILLFPVTIPVMIAGVRGTAALLQSPPDEAVATLWIGLLTSFDTVFLVLALWTFEPLMTE